MSRRALARWGGVLIAPRRTVAGLAADEGRRDGLVLGTLYVVGTALYPMAETIATVLSTHSLVALAAGVARVLLTPIVVLVFVETLLGGARSHRGGLFLLPLVVLGTLAHTLATLEIVSVPALWPDFAGAAAAGVVALWARKSIPVEPAQEADA
ncbi:MAG: hypothetical protein KUG77_21505 [Nannocystaceae bacterium]|nr:hypothetical protein [Nannocystaceae bacterium]